MKQIALPFCVESFSATCFLLLLSRDRYLWNGEMAFQNNQIQINSRTKKCNKKCGDEGVLSLNRRLLRATIN